MVITLPDTSVEPSKLAALLLAPFELAIALVSTSFLVSEVTVTDLAVMPLPLATSLYDFVPVTTTATAKAAPEGAVLASAVVLIVLVLRADSVRAPVALIELLPDTLTRVLASTTDTPRAASLLSPLPDVGARLVVTVTVLFAFIVTSPLLVICVFETLTVAFAGTRNVPLMMSLSEGAPTNARPIA